jgi:hypothetical protein
MIKLDPSATRALLDLSHKSRLYLEGNILKIIDADGDEEFAQYLKEAIELDKSNRRKRLEVTKQIQSQNKDLTSAQEENVKLMADLQGALANAEAATKLAEQARTAAEGDLDLLQKRTQFQLVGTIVKVALWVIMGVGITTTLLYSLALFKGLDTTLLGSTWSNMFSILLTNSFSIIGTIMGVKYATEKNE